MPPPQDGSESSNVSLDRERRSRVLVSLTFYFSHMSLLVLRRRVEIACERDFYEWKGGRMGQGENECV